MAAPRRRTRTLVLVYLLIVGAGAVGSYYGALLARDEEVLLELPYEQRRARLDSKLRDQRASRRSWGRPRP